jgi:hypothetical protein
MTEEIGFQIVDIGEDWKGFVYHFNIPSEEFTIELINLFIPHVWKKFAEWCEKNRSGSISNVELIIKKRDGNCTIGMKWHPMGMFAIQVVDDKPKLFIGS